MITLYQFQSCPFCSKVRALLTFIKEPFEVVEVSPFGMKELSFTDHKKVPVLKDGDEVIVESATIIEHINNKYGKFAVTDDAKEWTDWIDNTLVHYLPPLIHPNFKTSLQNFQRIIKPGQFGWLKGKVVRFAGAMAMPKVARKMKDKYNIVDAEREFLDAIDHWSKNGLKGNDFFGGGKPDYVDCSVFGVLNSCHELGVVKRAMQHSKEFALWYNRCHPLMT
ncbi:glutathione S-transferase N-terminal domain-containing protein [uncultured Cocleimonas sp.]|uniref:glutathione S-transferase N-terminal domain-containing protein n=1 Tax=uncultured Cocleimonas sp. TaxID=1051587 RepID=UPI002639DC43|nr:glutathione S-transferase N-terminal domain-containing protein [uncultured Cocleimonas sp.]